MQAATQDRALDPWRQRFDAFTQAAAGAAWTRELRARGMGRFEALGWPTPRLEAWKHTNLATVAGSDFELAMASPALSTALVSGPVAGARLVFINGHFCVDGSTIPTQAGVTVRPLGAMLGERDAAFQERTAVLGPMAALPALATAFMLDGAFVELQANAEMAAPVELVFVHSAGHSAEHTAWMTHPKIVVLAGSQSRGTLIERHLHSGNAACLVNRSCEMVLSDGAHFEHVVLQDVGVETTHLGHTAAYLCQKAQLNHTALIAGGGLTRHEMSVALQGTGAGCALGGLYLGRDNQHHDTQVVVEHAKPHGTSQQLFKGILDGRSTGVFGGVVRVHPNAMKTDARQMSRSLLLSPHAVAHTRPQLEILADDVKCAHGATVGQLDDDAAFYMRSRGLDETSTRRLLSYAFACDVLAGIGDATARRLCTARLRTWLGLEALEELLQ